MVVKKLLKAGAVPNNWKVAKMVVTISFRLTSSYSTISKLYDLLIRNRFIFELEEGVNKN